MHARSTCEVGTFQVSFQSFNKVAPSLQLTVYLNFFEVFESSPHQQNSIATFNCHSD